MKAYLFLLCFIGVVPATLSLLRPVGHKYYLIQNKVTWPVAQSYCRETYVDLATVESELDWLRLKAEVTREGLTDVAWVGLYFYNNWRWSLEDVPLTNTFQQWYSGQPGSSIGPRCCTSGPYGYWWNYPCTDLYPFICYNASNSASAKFVGVTSRLTWNGALAYCRKFHTDLAYITSTTDNDAMQSIAFRQGMSWIGPYTGLWMWSDGTNISSPQWLSGQPDYSYQNTDCAVLGNGMFSDTDCSVLNYFICHITAPVRERQIMKLRVKSDGSIFDSDVQSSILEMIKQKLEENGMLENTTVTWRKQSDGQIFHKEENAP